MLKIPGSKNGRERASLIAVWNGIIHKLATIRPERPPSAFMIIDSVITSKDNFFWL